MPAADSITDKPMSRVQKMQFQKSLRDAQVKLATQTGRTPVEQGVEHGVVDQLVDDVAATKLQQTHPASLIAKLAPPDNADFTEQLDISMHVQSVQSQAATVIVTDSVDATTSAPPVMSRLEKSRLDKAKREEEKNASRGGPVESVDANSVRPAVPIVPRKSVPPISIIDSSNSIISLLTIRQQQYLEATKGASPPTPSLSSVLSAPSISFLI